MPSARDAREWVAAGGLHGIGDSLYTPFSGPDGDDIDFEAYRTLVRYCVSDLGHDMLWLTSGLGEWWSLTTDEKKKLVEVAVDECSTVAPDTVIQVCTASTSAKDTLELTLHAQHHGADICYIQTPPMEVHGGEGVLRFFEYIAKRSDIALGMFNSPSSGYVLTPSEMAEIYRKIPAVVAVKEGVMDSVAGTAALHSLVPELAIWECDVMVYRAGWLQQGIVCAAQIGTSGWLYETPDRLWLTEYWEMIWAGQIADAIKFAQESGLDAFQAAYSPWLTQYPGRPQYFTHWGEAFRCAAEALGLPIGDYPYSRPPQGILPEAARRQIRDAVERAGLTNRALVRAPL